MIRQNRQSATGSSDRAADGRERDRALGRGYPRSLDDRQRPSTGRFERDERTVESPRRVGVDRIEADAPDRVLQPGVRLARRTDGDEDVVLGVADPAAVGEPRFEQDRGAAAE